jgi:hypothetical protein
MMLSIFRVRYGLCDKGGSWSLTALEGSVISRTQIEVGALSPQMDHVSLHLF